jgi:hypothetical protein
MRETGQGDEIEDLRRFAAEVLELEREARARGRDQLGAYHHPHASRRRQASLPLAWPLVPGCLKQRSTGRLCYANGCGIGGDAIVDGSIAYLPGM